MVRTIILLECQEQGTALDWTFTLMCTKRKLGGFSLQVIEESA
jgi:hypothetical protein